MGQKVQLFNSNYKFNNDKIVKWFRFYCPGCHCSHNFFIGKDEWNWNDNYETPTVNPSILSQISNTQKCHLFIKDGKIQFLSDSWHELKGTTVDMIDVNSVNL
jgi:hypothetical protein